MANLFDRLGKAAILPAEEQARLASEYQETGNKRALAKLVDSNLKLAQSVAKRHKRAMIDAEDLLSVAASGIVKAASKYNPDMGASFSTYARQWMIAECQAEIQRNEGTIRTGSRTAKILYASLPKYQRAFRARYNRDPRDTEIARYFKLNLEEVRSVMASKGVSAKSLDSPLSSGDDSEGGTLETVTPGNAPTPEALLRRKQKILDIRSAVGEYASKLSERERTILDRVILGEDTAASVGRDLGLTRQRISQIHKDINRGLALHLQNKGFGPRA